MSFGSKMAIRSASRFDRLQAGDPAIRAPPDQPDFSKLF